MARPYTRREFLTDASFAFGSSILLKVLAPQANSKPLPETAIAPNDAIDARSAQTLSQQG